MKPVLRNIDFKYFPFIALIVYVPFHLLEEALNNFPLWMSTNYNLPIILSYPHWLINNGFFFITLLGGLLIFYSNKIRFLAFGTGILIWSFINSIEHIFFSVIDLETSPGFYTAILFLLLSLVGIAKLYFDGLLRIKLLLQSILLGIGYWVIPISMILLSGNFLVEKYP
jgi:hypothetical protein